MRFVVDTMLGTLAKWLRVLGYDTLYLAGVEDNDILRISVSEDRTILSCDRELCSRGSDSLLIETRDLDGQISMVVGKWPPAKENMLTRCLECNNVLEKVAPGEAKGKVPEGVMQRYSEFWRCPSCKRVYWAGSHWENMRARAEGIIASRSNPR